MNARGELYGARRLERLLAGLPRDATPAAVAGAVLEDVGQFVGDASASDDLTLLVLRASGR
jgi:serine phosphatase RsbU (regulator of sigma subunit)